MKKLRTKLSRVTDYQRPEIRTNPFRWFFVKFCKYCIPTYWLCDAVQAQSDSHIVLSLRETKTHKIIGGSADGTTEFEASATSSWGGSVEHLKVLMDHMDARMEANQKLKYPHQELIPDGIDKEDL